jgi:hypothetical protein
MMKLFFAAIMMVVLPVAHGNKVEYTDNEHVKLTLTSPIKMKDGKTETLLFRLQPKVGIHVNTNPMFEFVLDKNSAFHIVGKPNFEKNAKGYLETSQPIIISLSPTKGIPSGKHILKGSLRYFFCSDKDGWCNRHAQPIEVSVEVTK